MDPKNLLALSKLLDEALDLPDDAARTRWLAALAPPDDALRPQLDKLLAAKTATGLDRGAPLTELLDTRAAPRVLQAGDRIGRYRLLSLLGQGGMAVVWLAESTDGTDPPRVALKFPAVSLDSAGFMERFAREQRFLATLHHPGIARLVEAGVTDAGQHFLALDYVDGLPLDAYCDTHGLGLRARIALMLKVLEAVAHAHAQSILHRDLKPSNILVDRAGEPRLLDFGIAKLLIDDTAQETELTKALGRAMTPHYASPEQVAGGSVGPASDVYALGVILYELVCGRRPYRADPRARMRLGELLVPADPVPPSQACRDDAPVTRAEGGAATLSRALAGDLDAIVLKALRRDPGARQGRVAELAADLAHWLAHEPVQSTLARWRFRAGLLLKPHRAAFVLALLLVLALGLSRQGHALAASLEVWLTPALSPQRSAVLVTIGPEDHQRLFGGASPLDAGRLQALVARILDGRPAVVGVDIETAAPAFAALRQAFAGERAARVVWGRGIAASDDASALPIPRPVLGGATPEGPWRWGLALVIADGGDGAVRWLRRVVATSEGAMPTLAETLVTGLRAADADGSPQALRGLRYARAERLELPASLVLADGFDWQQRIEGRVVVLGGRYDPTDVHATPIGLLHGIEILAYTIETELAGRANPRPSVLALLAIAALDLAVAVLLLRRHRRRVALPAILLVGALLAAGLAASSVFPAWPYALLVAVVVAASAALPSRRLTVD